MPANVAKAMEALERHRIVRLEEYSEAYKIRINSVGQLFEEYVKDLLAGFTYDTREMRLDNLSREFSYLGNQNFPPDAIAKGGDAFEIKKHEKESGTIALNSSQPRDMLYSGDSRITAECRTAVGHAWDSLDLFYVVGTVPRKTVRGIYFVQGKCYAARPEIYEAIGNSVSASVRKAIEDSGFENSSTTELGRINRADPLGRASLRIRGMWQIAGPSKAFADIAPVKPEKEFYAYTIMEKGKYDSMKADAPDVKARDAKVPDPNNPARLIDAVVMEVSW